MDYFQMTLLYVTFILTAFSVIGNDVIQTLGTFISSNKKVSWPFQLLFIGGILSAVVLIGWHINGSDLTYGRLDKIPAPGVLSWWILIPPIVLLILTRFGIPVSTTFLVLSSFSPVVLINKVLLKSLFGYTIAFACSFLLFYFLASRLKTKDKNGKIWMVTQWITTGTLWTMWLVQDLANVFVYFPRKIDLTQTLLLLAILLAITGFTLSRKGGKIQKVVDEKSKTHNLFNATIIDAIYAVVLVVFTMMNKIPMSTTWVFIGILAGREIGMRLNLHKTIDKDTKKLVLKDLRKVSAGLVVSLACAFIIQLLKS
jgi:phosphate/sulfate permease